jgi:hypothetical protein
VQDKHFGNANILFSILGGPIRDEARDLQCGEFTRAYRASQRTLRHIEQGCVERGLPPRIPALIGRQEKDLEPASMDSPLRKSSSACFPARCAAR